MRKLAFFLIFWLVTPLNLGVSLWVLTKTKHPSNFVSSNSSFSPPYQLYTAIPKTSKVVSFQLQKEDARPVIIKKYLKKYHSPLLPYAQKLLEAAERYGVDYRLLVAIAQCESNLCKKSPPGSYNCWGFENGATRFLSWEQAFNQVAKTLKEEYLDKGLNTPEKIMPKYAPPSVAKGGPWAKCVRQFIEELERGG